MEQFFPGCQCCQEPFGDGDLFHRVGDVVVCYRCIGHLELRPCRQIEDVLDEEVFDIVGAPGCR